MRELIALLQLYNCCHVPVRLCSVSLPRGNVGRVILSHVIVVVSSHIHLLFIILVSMSA